MILIFHVRKETVYCSLGEVLREAEIIQRLDGTMQTTIVQDGFRLIKIQVWMFPKLFERKTVDVQFARRGVIYRQVFGDTLRQITDLMKLSHADITAQSLGEIPSGKSPIS